MVLRCFDLSPSDFCCNRVCASVLTRPRLILRSVQPLPHQTCSYMRKARSLSLPYPAQSSHKLTCRCASCKCPCSLLEHLKNQMVRHQLEPMKSQKLNSQHLFTWTQTMAPQGPLLFLTVQPV